MGKINNTKKQKEKSILFFSPYFYPYISGITQYPYRLLSGNNLPYKTTCLTFRYNFALSSEERISDNLTIKRMPFWFRISKGFISPQSLHHFWHEVRKTDTVLVNLPSFEGIFLVLMAKLIRKPVVALLHCEVSLPSSPFNLLVNIILNCGVYLQLLCAEKIIVETKDYFLNRWPYSSFFGKIYEVFPLVNTSTPDVVFENKIKTIRKKHAHLVGFCGRVASEKGIEVLIESLRLLGNTTLIFAGPTGAQVAGEELYYEKIRTLLENKKIPHVFLGSLSPEELGAFYKGIDVLVLPSLNKTEAFGMVQVEAMLRGTPVVASSLPGVRIPLLMTKMGILTRPGSPQDIKVALEKIFDNKNLYANTKLTERAKKIFSVKKTVNELSRLLGL